MGRKPFKTPLSLDMTKRGKEKMRMDDVVFCHTALSRRHAEIISSAFTINSFLEGA